MAAVVVTGSGSRLPWYRRWLTGARLRRNAALAVSLVILVMLLILTPTRPAPGGAPSVSIPPGITPANTPDSPGYSKPVMMANGKIERVRCGPGVRQFDWSEYAPACEPAWHGNNGGSNNVNGVTGSTITITYRVASTASLALIYTILPPSVVGTNDEAVNTLNKYISLFNQSFELYGRKVVLKPFTGAGDFISEDTGSGQGAAQADALTVAQGIHAFADMSLVDTSPIYEAALEQQHVIGFSLYENPNSFYTQGAPYAFSTGPSCTKQADAIGAFFGKAMSNEDAIYAGDASLRSHKRVYGIVYPEGGYSTQCESAVVSALAKYGVVPKASKSVLFDITSLQTATSQAVDLMKNQGVTTIIDVQADPVTPIFYFKAAQAANYHPEWVFESTFSGGGSIVDPFVQNAIAKSGAAEEAPGLLTLGNVPLPRSQQEALRAYELANGGSTSGILPDYTWAYAPLLEFYDLLQAAGPYLNASTLYQAQFNSAMLPGSQGTAGELGAWTFGPGTVDPTSSYGLLRWSNTAISFQDGKPGAFLPCFGNKQFLYAANGSDVPANTQPSCATGSS